MAKSIKTENNFDFLRLFAAFCVIIGHCYELINRQVLGIKGDPYAFLTNTDTLGATGVILFFALSGYLVTQSLHRSKNIGDFIWKRLLRLVPALWVVVLVTVLIWGACVTSLSLADYYAHQDTRLYLRNLYFTWKEPLPGVFTNNPLNGAMNGSLWSLPIEVRCYAVLIVLGLCPANYRKYAYPLIFVLIVYWIQRHFTRGDFVVRFFKQESALIIKLTLPFFIAGAVALYQLERFLSIKVGLVLVAAAIYVGRFHDPGFRFAWVGYSIALSYLGLSLALNTKAWLSGLTRRGDYSYGLYLWAYPVQQTLLYFSPKMNMALYLSLCISITLLLAMVSWHCIEKPAQAYKNSNPLGFLKLPTYR